MLASYGLRTYIWNNRLKSLVLLAGFPVLLLLICFGVALLIAATNDPSVDQGIQDALATYDYATLGLDGSGGMRIGCHYGPAYRTVDHITDRITYYGTEVSKAARIEPVTPPGAVFVTEPFAAILALEAGRDFACRYVGRIPLAKKYGDYPMYRLTRAG